MATWIQLGYEKPIGDKKYTCNQLVDLDKVCSFVHDPAQSGIQLNFGGNTTVGIALSETPDAYTKVLEYMKQIEQQIK